VTALLDAGVLDRVSAGQIGFPFDAVKVELVLRGVEDGETNAKVIPARRRLEQQDH